MGTSRITRRQLLQTGAAAAAAAIAGPAFAAWPERTIKFVVTFPPGGASDIVARLIAEPLATKLGQPIIVDNRPGAGGSVGGQVVAQAPADGYTFMLSNSTPISIGPFAIEKQPYDPVTGFTHVALIGSAPCVIMANPKSGFRKLQELQAAGKAGRVDFGSGGPASIGHVYGELMKRALGLNLVHVPYRGGAPMATDLIAGVVPIGIDVLTAYIPYFKGGQIVPIAVTSSKRSPLVPDVPTVVELGFPQLVLDNFFGISGPAGLPQDIVTRMNGACNEVLAMPDIRRKMEELAILLTPGTPAAFTSFVREQVGQLSPIVKGAGVRL